MQPQQSNDTVKLATTGDSHSPKSFDPKFFVKSVRMDRATDRSVASSAPCDPSRYPPEIANFMSRVRNLSVDADSPASHGASLHEEEEAEEDKEEDMNPSDLFDQASPMVRRRNPTDDRRSQSAMDTTKQVLEQNIQRHRSNEFHSGTRPVQDTPIVVTTQSGSSPAQRKQEKRSEGQNPMGLSPSQRYRDTAMSWDAAEMQREKTTPTSSPSRSKNNLGHSWDSHSHAAMKRATVDSSPSQKHHEPDSKRTSFGPSTPELQHMQKRDVRRSWTDDPAQTNRDYPPPHPSMKSFSLPRGQGSPRLNQYRHDSSRESTPSGSQTQSDHGPAYYPPEHRSYSYSQHYHGRYEDSDVRRARSFNAQPPMHPQRYRHNVEEDSLPSSPTFFTHNPPDREEATPSPNTQAVNVSFQEHLNALDSARKGRKSRVMDWFQRTSDIWSYDSRLPMTKDFNADQPAQPYMRQSPVYASAEEILGGVQAVQHPPESSRQLQPPRQWYVQQSQPHKKHIPPQQRPQQNQRQPMQQSPMQQRQPSQQVPSQQYPPVTRPPENGSYHSRTFAGRGHTQQIQYPTATFTKDYYVIDV